MPKITHALLLAIILGNITAINAMEAKKDIVIVISNNQNTESLKTIFNEDQYKIVPIYNQPVTTAMQIDYYLKCDINQQIQVAKNENPNCQIFLYADHRFLYSLNYAANNAKNINGLILEKPEHDHDPSTFENLFGLKLSHIVKKFPSTMPVIIYNPESITDNDQLFCAILALAKTRQVKNLQFNPAKINHHTFFTSKANSSNIANILQKPSDFHQGIHQTGLPKENTNLANTINRQESQLYYTEWTIIIVCSSLLFYLLNMILKR
jgi:hypothetical protein